MQHSNVHEEGCLSVTTSCCDLVRREIYEFKRRVQTGMAGRGRHRGGGGGVRVYREAVSQREEKAGRDPHCWLDVATIGVLLSHLASYSKRACRLMLRVSGLG